MTVEATLRAQAPSAKTFIKSSLTWLHYPVPRGTDSTSADNTGNYTVLTNTKHGKKITTTPVAILSAEYTAPAFNVDFSLVDIRISKQAFAHGGESR